MSENLFSGKTAEEAVETGLRELGLTREEVQIEVIEEGKRKLFGSIPAQVRITPIVKQTDGERAVTFLEGLASYLNQTVSFTLHDEQSERILIELTGNCKFLIGRRGEVIDAIQTLAGAVANTGRKTYVRVVVDCDGYREDRENTLKKVAEKMAAKAVRLGKRVRLEPMNPYERRIIHSTLADNPDVTTKSEGKEPMRFVVVIPKNLKPFEQRDRGDRYRGGDKPRGRGDNRGFGGGRGDNRNRDRDKKTYPKRELPKDDTPQTSGTSLNRGNSNSGFRKGGFSGFFGTYLGNSREETETEENPNPEKTEE